MRAATRSLVTAAGGTIELSPAPGGCGTTAIVRLPTADLAPSAILIEP